jgi:parallel beta-helix repeat protein
MMMIGLLLAPLAAPPAGAHEVEETVPSAPCLLDAYRPDPTNALYNGTDPSRQLEAYVPFRIITYPCPRPVEERAIFLHAGSIELIAGGQLVRSFPFSTDETVPFERVVEAIADPTWAAEVEPGVFELSAAFVNGEGTSVTIAAPRITELRLLDLPSVFFGGLGSTARFEGVLVTSWDPDLDAPDQEPADGRPFVLYQESARLDVIGSEMSYLGSDRTAAYGVSWRVGGSTGEVLDSTFAHNFFGVYTFEAADIVFRGNVFRDNILYGFDPHDFSTGLVVEENEAYGNGSHGFIVSRSVTDSVLRRNHSYQNGGNGIMMDTSSDRNRIEANLVENNVKDGIVLLGSAENVVIDNVVRNQRVGIRLTGVESTGNRIEANLVEGHEIGLQAYGGASEMVAVDNTVLDSSAMGMALEAPRSEVRGGEIRGTPRGVGIRTATSLSGVVISDVDEGVVVADTGIADLDQLQVTAREESVRLSAGGLVEVRGSTMLPPAFESVETDDTEWLPFAGVGAILTAVLLELNRWRRERHDDVSPAPAQVWNRA